MLRTCNRMLMSFCCTNTARFAAIFCATSARRASASACASRASDRCTADQKGHYEHALDRNRITTYIQDERSYRRPEEEMGD
jgi:hypothetical protein